MPTALTRRRVRYARGYLELGLVREAATEVEAVDAAEQDDREVLGVRVDLHLAAREWEPAVQYGRRLAEAYPEAEHAWIGWAYALRELNRVAEARAVLLAAEVRHGGQSAVLHYNLACYEALLGDLARARERLAEACRMEPRFQAESRQDPDLRPLFAAAD